MSNFFSKKNANILYLLGLILIVFFCFLSKKIKIHSNLKSETQIQVLKNRSDLKSDTQNKVLRNRWELKPFRLKIVDFEKKTPNIYSELEIPFVKLKDRNFIAKVRFNTNTLKSKLLLNDGHALSFKMPGVPIALLNKDKEKFTIVFRQIPSNTLSLIDWNINNNNAYSLPISKKNVDYLFYRAAKIIGRYLYLIVYDNRSAKNYLRQYYYDKSKWNLTPDEIELPSLEDPAGTHYEMEPPIKIFSQNNGIRIIGGTLDLFIDGEIVKEKHIPNCERVLEAIKTPRGIVTLCNRKLIDQKGVYSIHYLGKNSSSNNEKIISLLEGIPWKLKWKKTDNDISYNLAKDARAYAEMLEYDIERGQNSGFLEFGSNNTEGRIAWSQIYYLNGLIDTIYMSRLDNEAFNVMAPLISKIRLRIELEIRLLDNILCNKMGMFTKAFTHDRSPALFAVQTSRVLLLFERYIKEFPDSPPLKSLEYFRSTVSNLDGHMEVLETSTKKNKWLEPGAHYLIWPKGNAFYFDGLAVPYNHQNEWAYSLFESSRNIGKKVDSNDLNPQREIVLHFLKQLSKNDQFPEINKWYYWWGKAYDGYDKSSNLSTNTPKYGGDKSLAWISFRTIDLMSVLSGIDFLSNVNKNNLLQSAIDRVKNGDVYPFASRSILENGFTPKLNYIVAQKYARSGSPWELSNQPWALAMLPQKIEEEDHHSIHLNTKIKNNYPFLGFFKLGNSSSEMDLLRYLEQAIPYNTGQILKYAGEELGGKYLAWNLDYDLRATLLAYENTGNRQFLKLFETAIEAIISIRDDKIGILDNLRGYPAKSWGSNRYSEDKQKWVAWDTFAGLTAYLLAKYCNLECHNKSNESKCVLYKRIANEALQEFSSYWVNDPSSGGGYYFDPYAGDIAPLNHMNSLALAHLELSKLLDGKYHKIKAEKLAKFFKHHWKKNGNNTVEWEYWPQAELKKNQSSSPEDVTHAQINLHFAYECYKHGIVFNFSDMQQLVQTFLKKIIRKNGNDWAYDLGGNGRLIESGLHEGIAGWVILDEFDPSVRRKISSFVMNHPEAYPLGQFSYATGPIAVAHTLKKE